VTTLYSYSHLFNRKSNLTNPTDPKCCHGAKVGCCLNKQPPAALFDLEHDLARVHVNALGTLAPLLSVEGRCMP